jgi:pantothenate kinase
MTAAPGGREDVASLRRLEQIAADLGNGRAAEQARSLGDRVGEGRFYVAILGQFKRGKSTLLNALLLLGAPVLPRRQGLGGAW